MRWQTSEIGPSKTNPHAIVTLQAKFREANFRERGIASGPGFTEE
jgi:hypothetical protein